MRYSKLDIDELTVNKLKPGPNVDIECESTSGGFIPPKMTTTQRDALQLNAGVVIYNITTNKLNFCTGSAWEVVTSA